MSNLYFEFEQDFVESLRCIPMIVRLKLDTCGVKLKLNHWYQLNSEEKENLVNSSCSSPTDVETYRQKLQDLLIAKTGSPAGELLISDNPDWLETGLIPE
ncbi:MAG: nitrate reductase associated protein, partial [Microcystaceae cyanobacterium]